MCKNTNIGVSRKSDIYFVKYFQKNKMSKYLLRISFYLLPTFGCFIIGYLISEKEFDQNIKYRLDS